MCRWRERTATKRKVMWPPTFIIQLFPFSTHQKRVRGLLFWVETRWIYIFTSLPQHHQTLSLRDRLYFVIYRFKLFVSNLKCPIFILHFSTHLQLFCCSNASALAAKIAAKEAKLKADAEAKASAEAFAVRCCSSAFSCLLYFRIRLRPSLVSRVLL